MSLARVENDFLIQDLNDQEKREIQGKKLDQLLHDASAQIIMASDAKDVERVAELRRQHARLLIGYFGTRFEEFDTQALGELDHELTTKIGDEEIWATAADGYEDKHFTIEISSPIYTATFKMARKHDGQIDVDGPSAPSLTARVRLLDTNYELVFKRGSIDSMSVDGYIDGETGTIRQKREFTFTDYPTPKPANK